MRSDSLFLFGSFLFALLLISASKPNATGGPYSPKAISIANATFQKDLAQFSTAAEQFHSAAVCHSEGSLPASKLRQNYQLLRKRFKRVSFMIEYLDKEAYDKVLNGAPLPKLEPKVADYTVLQPKGMQVLDELMGEGVLEASEIRAMADRFSTDVSQLTVYLSQRTFSDRQLFEAMRQEMVRLATLGITGFDTPGTLAGITDTRTVLHTLRAYGNLYAEELEKVGQASLLRQQQRLFQGGMDMANTSSFEHFNRLDFIKEVLNPLYRNLKQIHLVLDYETIDEVARYTASVNYQSENLFSENFLDPFYYVSIQSDSTYEDVARLGKLLFYDPVLSSGNDMACASCHAPGKAFTDGLPTSLSNTGQPMKRNAMTLNYSVYASGFFHDLRAKRLEDQFEHVVLSQDEFNSNYIEIIDKLATSPTYSKLFEKSFPTNNKEIRPYHIDYALTAYIMQLNSFDSPIDAYFQGKSISLPAPVKRGFNLFAGKAACATCHFMPTFSGLVPPLFIDSESEVLGVPGHKGQPQVVDADLGRADNGSTREVAAFFEHAFKTPTLRNIEKTGPYMHNGVFETLEEVMDFYNDGGGEGRGAIVPNQTLSDAALGLTKQELSDIIAFMKALTDVKVVLPPESVPRDFPSEVLNQRELIK